MKQIENQDKQENTEQASTEDAVTDKPKNRRWGLLFSIFLLLILIAAVAAVSYLGWKQFQQYQSNSQAVISELQTELAARPTRGQMDGSLRPLQQSVGQVDSRIGQLEQDQQSLLESTEKLYELYGRDENGWKLAEVEYLMSIAQHKLILEQDFEGAAKTLDAASSLIAQMADPGLLPVRVQINDEIAMLKTRKRPDLVGMTLLISRLTRQINTLTPEYVSKTKAQQSIAPAAEQPMDPDMPMDKKVLNYISSLVTIKKNESVVNQPEVTQIIDVRQKLEDNLKLTRWAVLERDATQYDRLMAENIEMFSEYYDLQDAANADFHSSLIQLQKSSLKAEFPDISGSLTMLKEIQQKRENAPQQEAENG